VQSRIIDIASTASACVPRVAFGKLGEEIVRSFNRQGESELRSLE